MKILILASALLFSGVLSASVLPLPTSWLYMKGSDRSLTLLEQKTSFLLPNYCSGLIGEMVEGNGTLNVQAESRWEAGVLKVEIKLQFAGAASSSLAKQEFVINEKLITRQNLTPLLEPQMIAIDGALKLKARKGSDDLFLFHLGHITVHPDGRLESHVFEKPDAEQAASLSIYCSDPLRS